MSGEVPPMGKYTQAVLRKRWEALYDGYLTRFGISDHYAKVIEKKKEIAALKVQRMETGDRTINTFIKIAEVELDELLKDNGEKQVDFFESKAQVEAVIGYRIDPYRTSVTEFYSTTKTLKAKSKAEK